MVAAASSASYEVSTSELETVKNGAAVIGSTKISLQSVSGLCTAEIEDSLEESGDEKEGGDDELFSDRATAARRRQLP